MVFEFSITSEAETQQVAYAIASVLRVGDVVMLQGDLGVGKTTFVKKLLVSADLQTDYDVTSPTFNIVNNYVTATGVEVQHVDFYRLEKEEELEEIGIEDKYDTTITFIEWGDKFPAAIPKDYIKVIFTFESADKRIISIEGFGDCRGQLKVLESIQIGR